MGSSQIVDFSVMESPPTLKAFVFIRNKRATGRPTDLRDIDGME